MYLELVFLVSSENIEPVKSKRPDICRSLNSDISYFGVGGKQAIFFIGNSARVCDIIYLIVDCAFEAIIPCCGCLVAVTKSTTFIYCCIKGTRSINKYDINS